MRKNRYFKLLRFYVQYAIKKVLFSFERFMVCSFQNRFSKNYVLKKIKGKTAKKKKYLIFFVHFDKQGCVQKYVYYLLKALEKIGDIVFISNSGRLSEKDQKRLVSYCISVWIRKNKGYDFGAWKDGILNYVQDFSFYQGVLCMNDSVLGPLFELQKIISRMEKAHFDFWAMTKSYQVQEHLQSYFLVFSKKVAQSAVFLSFWKKFPYFLSKRAVIWFGEVPLAKTLAQYFPNWGSAFLVGNEKNAAFAKNPSVNYWKELICNEQFPFLKREVFLKKKTSSEKIFSLLKKHTFYLVSLLRGKL